MTIAVLLSAIALAASSPAPSTETETGPSARIERDGNRWTVTFELDRDAAVWAFDHSAVQQNNRGPWRPGQWRVETPGVVLERAGHRDVLRATDGGPVPRQVRIAISPVPTAMEASYAPALLFSDGSVALHTEQYELFPLDDVEAAAALPPDLTGLDLPGGPVAMTWVDAAGPVLFQGLRQTAPVATDVNTYVLFGPLEASESPHLATVIDPALPDWIGRAIADTAPRYAAFYADRLGEGPEGRPAVMASWKAPPPGMTSMGGSVLPGLIAVAFEGEGVLEPSGGVADMFNWFIAHESVHFWLGHTVSYASGRDMWITEGGADLLALRAAQALDPAFDADAMLQSAVDDCAELADQPIHTAAARNENRAYYACGAVFGMLAEAAARERGGDAFTFVRGLIDANRDDGLLDGGEWLAELTRLSGDPSMAADMAVMLEAGTADPVAMIASLFQRAGVAHEVRDGRVVLL
ncbi:hypothetical protein [Brevundimonas sp.]|uniref:hypothetical protein n=1 Tax=Brevundimonas sp. TaxID=1871086 RepID=UPI00391CA1A4